MPVHDELGKRMKENYEYAYRFHLTKRMPVILRIDGRAFHTFTRDFYKPYDRLLMDTMQETMKEICANIGGNCVFGYTQSDEISILLIDYKRFNSSAWFDNNLQKLCSISASMATLYFNKIFARNVDAFENDVNQPGWNEQEINYNYDLLDKYKQAIIEGGMFDTRAFNIPKEEVCNYFYWRQVDAVRNSIEMAGFANFTPEEMHKKTQSQVQEMLFSQKGINWNEYPADCKQGACTYRREFKSTDEEGNDCIRHRWVIDQEIPKFNTNREYIEKWLVPEEE